MRSKRHHNANAYDYLQYVEYADEATHQVTQVRFGVRVT